MNEEEGNKQTTQGIWMSVNPNLKTIVIDCEGTDSKERGEDRHHFEHCSSLFALAMADILIMNMWTQDVGRYTASNYGVLKMVFQMNLKLFTQDCAKKILIVLRDYDEKRYKKDKFERQILDDIDKIWEDIKKPANLLDSKPGLFFDFEFITLPHKIYREVEFDEQVSILRDRFDSENKDYLFKHTNLKQNVPVDGYTSYSLQIWDTIIHEKDLNIPGQKEMIAIFRCGEIKQEALNNIKPKLFDLIEESRKAKIDKFNERVKSLYDTALEEYDRQAINYLEKIYLDIKNSLSLSLINELFFVFSNQVARMIPIAIKMFTRELEIELKKSKFN